MKTLPRTIRLLISLFVLSAVSTGCAGSHSQYAWSHAMSGDYLFAYDTDACEQSAGSSDAPQFFACMESLGYYQIDTATGAPVATTGAATAATAAVATSAAR